MARRAAHPRANHTTTAAALRRAPGVWQRVSVHRASANADNAAARIRTARELRCYEPAGTFEAEVRVYGDDYSVHARYLGAMREAQVRREQVRAELGINDQKGRGC